MTWSQSLKTAAAAAFLCTAIATPVLAAPVPQAPIATEQLGGTILSLTPQIAYGSATLRISGPGGYALTKRFAPGTPISADLLTEAEPVEGAIDLDARRFLTDGRYRYEVVLATAPRELRLHTGMFFVESGAAMARDAKQAALGAIREDLAEGGARPEVTAAEGELGGESLGVDDALSISDVASDGITGLYLHSSMSQDAWSVRNYNGDFRIKLGLANRMFIDSYGQVGIGTATPQQELHIVDADGADLRLSGSGADWWLGINASTNHIAIHDATTGSDVLVIEQDAPPHSLVIGADGKIGLGTTSPAADFEVRGHVRGTTFASASSRELKAGFQAVDPAEILAKLSDLPVTSWRYKDDDDGATHLGPVAEDFQRLFGLGDGETIANVDAVGVLIAAVQALQNGLQHKDREIERLTARVAALEARPTDTAGPPRALAPSTTQGGLP